MPHDTTTIENVTDPVCGMTIDAASAAGHTDYHGRTYHFCSNSCKTKFDADPAKYAGTDADPAPSHEHAAAGLSQRAATDGSHHTRSTSDGVGERVDFPINGMSCAACARRVEQGLTRAPGVRKASVNFATNKATVEYDPRQTGVRPLLDVVRNVGYEPAEPARVGFVVDDSARPAGSS